MEGNDREQITEPQRVGDRRVHMANERTFLAWVRTGISIMAFGFVVERFSLFVRQVSDYLGTKGDAPSPGYTSLFGVVLVGLGALMGILAFFRYRTVERQIASGTYAPSLLLTLLLTLALLAIAMFLVMYLVHSL